MPPIVVGHRGAAGLAPENTLPGFLHAYSLGLRLLELDVRLTRDGRAVCFHDDRLDRLTAAVGPVSAWDWEPLAALPVLPGAFDGAYADARIPLLETVLSAVPHDCRFLVELKADPERPDELVAATLEILQSSGALDRCRVISFEQELLERVRALGDFPLGVIVGGRDGAALLPRARAVGAVAVHPHHSLVDPDLIAAARSGGFQLNTWTVNSREEYDRLASLGVDEVTTDFPDRLAASALP